MAQTQPNYRHRCDRGLHYLVQTNRKHRNDSPQNGVDPVDIPEEETGLELSFVQVSFAWVNCLVTSLSQPYR
ncbi:hypothetical protein [Phormidesmis priestleyi]|uniref:hypothetical protein n=1 Tax=Phormidesmis priestleyi TaxID=268141 RepID=UPI0012E82202|nr:hypothetical protein [Phormidesmis priestleyi]